ncbi:hypothetical protein CPB85DRAFT_1237708, partial [Mucidula mucida]
FSMVVSDTTKNVKKARALIAKKWPWILNAGDPCHQLNLMAKDIIVGSKTYPKIKPFAAIIAQVSSITTFFSHSNYSQFWLKKELKKEKDKRGIKAAGATRFSSFSTNAKSVQRCFPALQRAYKGGHLKFDTAAGKNVERLVKTGLSSRNFLSSLETVNSLLTPIDRGLKTLESSNVTCSDVLLIYIGIAIGFKQTFQTDGNEIFFLSSNLLTNHSAVDDDLLEHRTDTFNVFNHRFHILMTEST